jgi:hypothetical protein
VLILSAEMRARFTLIFSFVLGGLTLSGQYYDKLNAWRKQRHELMAGVGMSNYLGELGGGDGKGRRYLPLDLEISMFKVCYYGGYRLNTSYRTALRAYGFYGTVAGSDQLTGNPERAERNLSFESKIYEGSLLFEYFILRAKPGHIYHIKGTRGQKGQPFDVVAFAGVGAFYFDPKAEGVKLRSLGTEGQGLAGGSKPYGPISITVPIGIAGYFNIPPRIKVGLEVRVSPTLTDYLDDVSGKYYDNDKLRAEKGALSAEMADRSLGKIPGATAEGAPRGNPKNRDLYLHGGAVLVYNISNMRKKVSRPGGVHSFLKKGRKARF